jgi:hypothetical protein
MGWFDDPDNAPGKLTAMLSTDGSHVQKLSGSTNPRALVALSSSRDLWSSQQRHAVEASVSDRVHGSPRAASLRRFVRLISGTGGWARLSDYVDLHISWLCSCC